MASTKTIRIFRISAGPHRNRRVHDMIAEAMLGRELKSEETVHHVDHNKLNCDWRNLEVLGRDAHGAVSSRQHGTSRNTTSARKRNGTNSGPRPIAVLRITMMISYDHDHVPDEELLGDDAAIIDAIEAARAEAAADADSCR